jgi:hypothetical protein
MNNETNLNTNKNESAAIEESLRFRVKLNKNTHERFKSVQEELKSRGVLDFTLSDYVNFILDKSEFDNKIVGQFTPLEFKLKTALKDENLRKKLEKLISG